MTATAPRWLIALDPGLDVTGWALFDRHRLGAGVTLEARCAPALVDLGRLETAPDQELEARLASLAQQLAGRFWQQPAAGGEYYLIPSETEVVIERPAAVSLYGRHARDGKHLAQLHASLEKLQLAIGALHGEALAAHVAALHLVRTPGTPKPQKQAIARRILAARVDATPCRTIEDERDALFLACWWLETGAGRARVEAARRAAAVAHG